METGQNCAARLRIRDLKCRFDSAYRCDRECPQLRLHERLHLAVGDFQIVAPLIRYLVLQLYKSDSLRIYVQALQGELPVSCLRWMDLLP